jgi:hypothetical protein
VEANLEATQNKCMICWGTKDLKVGDCCTAFVCQPCIDQTKKTSKRRCPNCTARLVRVQFMDFDVAFKVHRKIASVVAESEQHQQNTSNGGKVMRWLEENLEAQMPSGREEEKGGTELNQVDGVWFQFMRDQVRSSLIEGANPVGEHYNDE